MRLVKALTTQGKAASKGIEDSTPPASEPAVEPSGVQALKNPNPLKDVEALAELAVAVLF